MKRVPGRMLRLEEIVDFMHVIKGPRRSCELDDMQALMDDELRASDELADIFLHNKRVLIFRKVLSLVC